MARNHLLTTALTAVFVSFLVSSPADAQFRSKRPRQVQPAPADSATLAGYIIGFRGMPGPMEQKQQAINEMVKAKVITAAQAQEIIRALELSPGPSSTASTAAPPAAAAASGAAAGSAAAASLFG